jgi:Ca-activated chloride channel family protein
VLIAAAARPQKTVAVPVERASIMLLTDNSGSMHATDVIPDRLTAAKRAAQRFVARVPARVNVGVLAFNQTPRVLQSPTRDRDQVAAAIDRMTPSGGTATGEAIATATKVLTRTPGELGRRPPGAIVLLSDGASTSGRDPIAAAQAARKLKIPVYTVGVGGTQPSPIPLKEGYQTFQGETVYTRLEEKPLQEIARISRGTYTPEGGRPLALGRLFREQIEPRAGREDTEDALPVYQQRYAWFLGPALLFLALEMVIGRLRRGGPR